MSKYQAVVYLVKIEDFLRDDKMTFSISQKRGQLAPCPPPPPLRHLNLVIDTHWAYDRIVKYFLVSIKF